LLTGRATEGDPVAWIDVAFLISVALIVVFAAWCIRALVRQDRWRRKRPHPTPEEGGRSFGDATHWGGWGRPGH
jgi:hypothetical protein